MVSVISKEKVADMVSHSSILDWWVGADNIACPIGSKYSFPLLRTMYGNY